QNQTQSSVGEYIRLEDFKGADLQPIKVKEAVKNKVDYRYSCDSKSFNAIPGSPIAYWLNKKARDGFQYVIGNNYSAVAGISTGNNNRYIFDWYEVDYSQISFSKKGINCKKYYPHAKGGDYRRWYGNRINVIKYNEQSIKEM